MDLWKDGGALDGELRKLAEDFRVLEERVRMEWGVGENY